MASKKDDSNLAKKLKAEERKKIAIKVVQDYDTDIQGRSSWQDRRDRFYKLWMTQRDPKNTPFPGASNVCLPILAIACNQFHARSYQAMFTPASFLKTMPVAEDDIKRAKSVESIMNWQMLYDIPDYEDEHDKLLLGIPINGGGNMKITWDFENERPDPDYVSSMDLVLPYRTRCIEEARRKTHRVFRHYEELEMLAAKKGRYIDFDKLGKESSVASNEPGIEETKDAVGTDAQSNSEKPHLILEQYRYWKMPWDNEAVPYTFTVDYDSQTLLRLTDRVLTAKGKTYVFDPFVDYTFFPNPEGYYPFGFGHFLEQLNEMANTAFNQIFDSGRLSNQPFGFYGRRSGIKRREIKLWPGRMEEVEDATQVYFPNMQRVDQVLFQVLGLIENFSQQFTSTGDYMLGRESKGTRTPTASGTLAIIEQGLTLYNTMIKREFRSLKKEFQKIYLLDQMSLPEKKQYVVLGSTDIAFKEARRADFDGKMHIIPVGDPTYASKLSRRQDAQAVYQGLLMNPLIFDPATKQVKEPQVIFEATRDWLETYDKKDFYKLLPKMKEQEVMPEAENALLMQLDDVEVKEVDDHVHHLEVHERIKKTPFYKEFDEDAKKALDAHILEHKGFMHKMLAAREGLGGGTPPPNPALAPGAPEEMPQGAPPPAGGVAPTGQAPPQEGAVPPGAAQPVPDQSMAPPEAPIA